MDIEAAKLKLKLIHSNLYVITTFISQFKNEVNTLSQVRVRLEELPNLSKNFEEYQAVVEQCDPKPDEVKMKDQTKFRAIKTSKLY
ncbi:Hypothetical protein CINCED_3A009852 [Cinara cedri]|uniref:Uncharacterized protein n=1 Tax=Cinara cedri TaxID=506608 RepID=A0A5E4MQZ0_9HEMI|nr:Hypothetical protein CINCED_3A009852 [Cinara cedri]